MSQFGGVGMFYCELCKVQLSGPEPARQHYESAKHKRKEAMQQHAMGPTMGMGQPAMARPPVGQLQDMTCLGKGQPAATPAGNPNSEETCIVTDCSYPGCYYHCKVCEIHISGPEDGNKNQHLAGNNHKKMLSRRGLTHVSSQPILAAPACYSSLLAGPGMIPKVSTAPNLLPAFAAAGQLPGPALREPNGQLPVSGNSQNVAEEEYSFDTIRSRGICYICGNIQLTSNEHARQHLGGDPHRKKKLIWESLRMRSVPATTAAQANNQPLENITSQLSGMAFTSPSTYQTPVNPGIIGMATTNPSLATAAQLLDRTIWYDCKVCFKKLNSEDQLRIHMNSHPGYGTSSTFGNLGFGAASNLTGIDIVPKDKTVDGQPHYGVKESAAKNLTSNPFVQNLMAETIRSDSATAKPSIPSSLFSMDEPPNRIQDTIPGVAENYYRPSAAWETRMTNGTNAMYPMPANEPEAVNNSDDVITTGKCTFPGCYYHCTICEQHISGSENKVQHLRGRPHEKNLKRRSPPNPTFPTHMTDNISANVVPGFDRFCDVCQVPFNVDSADAHMKGKQHRSNAAKTQTVPDRKLPECRKSASADKCEIQAYKLTSTGPRSYQIELFQKAMADDTVIFLPTGTGKTLISCMVMSYMLQINPHRPVLFLVDKVLLVIQQSQVIQEELGGKNFDRWDEDSNQVVSRPLRIAAICGDKTDTDGVPLWQQDVIVVTADFYRNLLEKETPVLRWSDNCLVVFDEAHHCTKTHPFNVLLQKFHVPRAHADRPKILGLTASPAGQESVAKTKEMLYRLLQNMGSGKLAMVEENETELSRHKSCTQLIPIEVGHSAQERDLRDTLERYVLDCYQQLEAISNLGSLEVSGLKKAGQSICQNLSGDIVDEMILALDMVKPRTAGHHIPVEVMKIHMRIVCEAFRSIDEIGLGSAFMQLEGLTENKVTGNFAHAKELQLKCTALERMVIEFLRKRKQNIASHLPDMCNNPDLMPAVSQLIREILEKLNWGAQVKPIALVLVQKRTDALTLTKILQETPLLLQKGIQTVRLVGHGSGGGDGGMAVNKQERILAEVKEGKYQVIVATSVAEEGVDMPACELVVQMDPPNNVRALVQLRGRARKKNSIFVALCRSAKQKSEIDDLLMREQNMKEAVAYLVAEQKHKETACESGLSLQFLDGPGAAPYADIYTPM